VTEGNEDGRDSTLKTDEKTRQVKRKAQFQRYLALQEMFAFVPVVRQDVKQRILLSGLESLALLEAEEGDDDERMNQATFNFVRKVFNNRGHQMRR